MTKVLIAQRENSIYFYSCAQIGKGEIRNRYTMR
jgi:hypothetical protein